MADQLTLTTIGGTATHTLTDSGNAVHTGTVTGTTIYATTALATDTISERTSAAGVTVDGVLLKDGVNRGTMFASNVFLSGEQTGTGSAQNVAHGFGATPVLAFVILTGHSGGPVTITYGTHTSTNVVVTVSSGETFRVVAFK